MTSGHTIGADPPSLSDTFKIEMEKVFGCLMQQSLDVRQREVEQKL